MQSHKTVEEKAAEWDITSRHVQYLCRTGKIEGAVKRAGAWFIPGDAPVPLKNTKSDAKGFKFVGTKKAIFESAIELFVLKGFNEISLRDIAGRVGVRQSTIYNHFKSKQEILDTIYDFYCHYFLTDRPDMNEMERVLQDGSFADIMACIRYNFKEEYEQKMSDITKIVFQRIAIDDRAKQIAKSLVVDESIEYVEAVFDRGVEIGRFAQFDTHAMAVFINSVRVFTLYNWIVDPSVDTTIKLMEDEQNLYRYASTLITDLKPPVTVN